MGFGLAPAITDESRQTDKHRRIVQCSFREEVAVYPKVGRSIVTPKAREATVSIDTPNVVEITIAYVRRYHGGGEFRSSLHCVDHVDVLPQKQNSDDGLDRIHSSRSDHTMLNCSRK